MKQWLQELWDEHKEFISSIIGIAVIIVALKLLALLTGVMS